MLPHLLDKMKKKENQIDAHKKRRIMLKGTKFHFFVHHIWHQQNKDYRHIDSFLFTILFI